MTLALMAALAGLIAVALPTGYGWASAGFGAVVLTLLFIIVRRRMGLERQIRQAAAEWQLTIDSFDFPILTLDGEGLVLRLNRAAATLSAKPFVKCLGRRAAELGAGEPWDTADSLAGRARDRGRLRKAEVHDPATGRTWELTAQPVSESTEARPSVTVIAQDVTDRLAREAQQRRQEMLATLGALVAGVAHEVRNPLFTISSCLVTLEERLAGPAEHAEIFEVLHRERDRLSSLMQALLDYGKPWEAELRPGSLVEMMDELRGTCCAPLADERRVELAVSWGPSLPRVPMDYSRLYQAFRNLLENAVQHASQGGRVSLRLWRDEGWVECEVRDDGPGFAPADLPHVFEPFFSRRRGGTGLGLAIARRVVEEHGGTLEAANHPEGGAVLRVRLPVADNEPKAPPRPSSEIQQPPLSSEIN
jgi:signal transduction histidine kinase